MAFQHQEKVFLAAQAFQHISCLASINGITVETVKSIFTILIYKV